MEDNMNKINKLPRFMPGQVIDLSYRNKGLPNRLLIQTVFVKEQSKEWLYEALLENTGEVTVLEESFIMNNITNKEAPVYKCNDIIRLYNDGWRFCGNFCKKTARSSAAKYSTNRYIRNIELRPALNAQGKLIQDKYGMWIRYHNTIYDNGTIMTMASADDVIVIK